MAFLSQFMTAAEVARLNDRQVEILSAHRPPHYEDPDPPLHVLPEPEFLAALRRLNGTPQEILDNHELMAMLVPILRADFALRETYVHGVEPPLECPFVVMGGMEDTKSPVETLSGWGDLTRGECLMQRFPGDHFYLRHAEASVLAFLSRVLQPYACPSDSVR